MLTWQYLSTHQTFSFHLQYAIDSREGGVKVEPHSLLAEGALPRND